MRGSFGVAVPHRNVLSIQKRLPVGARVPSPLSPLPTQLRLPAPSLTAACNSGGAQRLPGSGSSRSGVAGARGRMAQGLPSLAVGWAAPCCLPGLGGPRCSPRRLADAGLPTWGCQGLSTGGSDAGLRAFCGVTKGAARVGPADTRHAIKRRSPCTMSSSWDPGLLLPCASPHLTRHRYSSTLSTSSAAQSGSLSGTGRACQMLKALLSSSSSPELEYEL